MFERLLGLFKPKEVTYTLAEVNELVENIKLFNAGVIDHHLSKHVDDTFVRWLAKKEVN